MEKKRYNELILLATQIQEDAHRKMREYLEKTYANAGPESMGERWKANS